MNHENENQNEISNSNEMTLRSPSMSAPLPALVVIHALKTHTLVCIMCVLVFCFVASENWVIVREPSIH